MKHYSKSTGIKVSLPKMKEVPYGDGAYLIRVLSGYEAMQVRESALAAGSEADKSELVFKLIAMSVVDDNGECIFVVEDVKKMDIQLLNLLASEIQNTMNVSDEAIGKAKEELQEDFLKGSSSDTH